RRGRRLFPHLARRGLDRRRHVCAPDTTAPGRPRTHRRQRETAPLHRRIAGIPSAGRRARGRAPAAGAARLSQGSPGRRIPEVPAVSGRCRSAAGHRDQPEVLWHAARSRPADRAAGPVPEPSTATRPAMSRADTPFSKVRPETLCDGIAISLFPRVSAGTRGRLRQRAAAGTPMTPPDDLDALVNELNAGAPRPAVRDSRAAGGDDLHTARLRGWLVEVIERSGSDLLLVAGAPPSIRVDGVVTPLNEAPLGSEEIE